jgi:hypothetical protein
MTYGWAILVIVIVLAALLYLNVFNPPTPDYCTFQTGILCTGLHATVQPSGALSISVTNGLAETVMLCNLACDDSISTPPVMQECSSGGSAAVLKTGESGKVTFANSGPCTDASGNAYPVGGRYRGKIYLMYSAAGDTGNARVATGNVIATIQP